MTKKIDKDKYKDKDNDKDKDKDKDILRTPPKSNPRDLWPLRHLFRVMRRQDMTKKITKLKTNTKTKTKTMTYTFRALETCDLRLDTWDTDFISDNWEQQYQDLHCDPWIKSDGDSIRNSCDVFFKIDQSLICLGNVMKHTIHKWGSNILSIKKGIYWKKCFREAVITILTLGMMIIVTLVSF